MAKPLSNTARKAKVLAAEQAGARAARVVRNNADTIVVAISTSAAVAAKFVTAFFANLKS